jgi:tungstate transport system substrate-binding protein
LAALVPLHAAAQSRDLRLAVVPSPEDTGLLAELLPDFERESGYRVAVYSGEDVYDVARSGQADLVISHYGHSGVDAFMAQGLGQWPRALFGNQIALIGPVDDPAQIRGLLDPGEALRRIAQSGRARFVSNNSSIMKYLETVLWEAAGRPAKGSWYEDAGAAEAAGMNVAARLQAYYLFAMPPFVKWKQDCSGASCRMDALLLAGPMPHRIMFSIVMNPQRFPAANVAGANALQEYLLRPAVQARVEAFRDPATGHTLWKAAGLNNSPAGLGLGGRP